MRIRDWCKLPDERDWLWGNLGLALMGGAMLSKFLIRFSVNGPGCVPCLLIGLRSNYGRVKVLLQKDLYQHTTAPRIIVVSYPDAMASHC